MLRVVLYSGSAILSVFAAGYIHKLLTGANEREPKMKVIFFPDQGIVSGAINGSTKDNKVVSRRGCLHLSTSLIHLVSLIDSAKETIDICLLIFTLPQLCDKLLEVKSRGVRIRILIDQSMAYCTGSRIPKLLSRDVEVVQRKSNCGMLHHKFVLVDSNTSNASLATGSFNWTWEAVTSNDENVIITNHSHAVQLFRSEFEKLWAHWNSLTFRL